MFASVNARAEWSRLNRPQIGHRQDTEIPLLKHSKSLIPKSSEFDGHTSTFPLTERQ